MEWIQVEKNLHERMEKSEAELVIASKFVSSMSSQLGMYISVPFCKAKCTFCNFASGAFAPARMDRYVDRLCQEIAAAHANAAKLEATLPDKVDTLYFGGGTPSLLLPSHLRHLCTRLRSEFSFDADAEITLECAPGQLAGETLEELQRQGLNRVSLGVQSFVDRESVAVGRLHTRQICLEEIDRLRAAGVKDINVDLIVGLPHQTESSWLESLQAAVATGVPHISVYMLEVDEDSRLGREMLDKGSRYSASAVPTEDEAADWYQLACNHLNAAGVGQYEISNFARVGCQSRHNLKYWHRDPYLGFGLDAYSMLKTRTGVVRFSNTSNLDLYSADADAAALLPLYQAPLPLPEIEVVSTEEAFEESLFLGLRLNAGVRLTLLRERFGEALFAQSLPAIQEVCEAGLLCLSADSIALTDRGRMVSNEVFSRLLLDRETPQELLPA
jgi:oxygen-independent coproporphyrinogen-3 oxidase